MESAQVMGNEVSNKAKLSHGPIKRKMVKSLAFASTAYNKLGGTHGLVLCRVFGLVRHYYKTFKNEIDNRNKGTDQPHFRSQ